MEKRSIVLAARHHDANTSTPLPFDDIVRIMSASAKIPSARVCHIDYPAEVDDLIADRHPDELLSFAAAAGNAIVASSRLDRAFLFSIPAGSASDAIPVPLPARPANPPASLPSHPPLSLCMWLSEKSTAGVATAVGVAVLSYEAVLRLYTSISLDQVVSSESLPCFEVRLDNALSSSISDDTPCFALHVSTPLPNQSSLIVFGTRGSAVLVDFSQTQPSVRPLNRDLLSSQTHRSTIGFGSMFYSAIRSIGAGIGSRDSDWRLGQGMYSVVNSHPVEKNVVLVRKDGHIEMWNNQGLLWTFNHFNPPLQTAGHPNFIISSAITSDATLVVLSQIDTDRGMSRNIRCYDIRSSERPPSSHFIAVEVDRMRTPSNTTCGIVVCCDVVCRFVPELGHLAWHSVARGLSEEGQVQGSLNVTPVSELFCLADISRGLFSSPTSGVAACLHQNGILLSCFEVPAPVSRDLLSVSSGPLPMGQLLDLLWTCFLQYNAGQGQAARASLQGLVDALVSRRYDTSETLSQIVHQLSRNIICKDLSLIHI